MCTESLDACSQNAPEITNGSCSTRGYIDKCCSDKASEYRQDKEPRGEVKEQLAIDEIPCSSVKNNYQLFEDQSECCDEPDDACCNEPDDACCDEEGTEACCATVVDNCCTGEVNNSRLREQQSYCSTVKNNCRHGKKARGRSKNHDGCNASEVDIKHDILVDSLEKLECCVADTDATLTLTNRSNCCQVSRNSSIASIPLNDVTCCDASGSLVNHKLLKLKPRHRKRRVSCLCDSKCVDKVAKALCEKEGHKDEVCLAHKTIAHHYSDFLSESREILWGCMCSILNQLDLSISCCDTKRKGRYTSNCSPLYPCCSTSAERSHRKAVLKSAVVTISSEKCCPSDKKYGIGDEESKVLSSAREVDIENIPAPEKLSLSIKGMTCSSCEKKALKALDGIMGVTDATVSYLFSKGQVKYFSNLTTPRHICLELERKTGFKVSVSRTDENSFYILSKKQCSGEVFEQVESGVWKIPYDPRKSSAREKMYSLGLDISDIIPNLKVSDSNENLRFVGFSVSKEARDLLIRFCLGLLFTIPILVFSWGHFSADITTARSSICLVFGTIVQYVGGYKIYRSALNTIKHRHDLDSDCLVALSTMVAYIYSVTLFGLHRRGLLLDESEIFEASSLLLIMVVFGKAITACIKTVAAESMKFDVYQPDTMCLKQFGEEIIPASLLAYNDHIVLKVGDVAVTDGVILSGAAEFDESHISGESTPVLKRRGANVLTGAALLSGSVTYRATNVVQDNSVTNIRLMLNSMMSFRTSSSDAVDLVAKYLTPVMLMLSCIAFIIWVVIGLKVRSQSIAFSVADALTYAIGMLAVSCPCALVLVIPLVSSLGIAEGKKRKGILLKSAKPVNIAKNIKHIVFDKTGTLTTDKLRVKSAYLYDHPELNVRSLIVSMISENRHPVAKAVLEYLFDKSNETMGINLKFDKIEDVVGSGIYCMYQGKEILAGKPKFVGLKIEDPLIAPLYRSGLALFCVKERYGATLAVIGVSSTLRDGCREVLDQIRTRKIEIHVLSGDTKISVNMLCNDLGITNYMAEVSPEGKCYYIQNLKEDGKVMFCGDGANDTIALAEADIGFSVNKEGLALVAADACLLNDDLRGVLEFLNLCRNMNYRINIGIIWCCIYNLFAVLIVSGAFVHIRIGPDWAGISEIISILPIFFIALSIKLL
ncbi:E1-E2 ATPase-domain-containing protein [Dipodascopsis uninucleata]